MLNFIQLLKQRYQTVLAQQGNGSRQAVYRQRVDQLILAEALLRKGQLLVTDKPALQIAVIGPTQVGKSSLVNVLANVDVAGVSPLAGYTVHPQGFCHGLDGDGISGLQHYFGRFQCIQQAELSKHRHDCFSLAEISGRSPYLPNCVLWDTPDFDSIDSATYREGVIRTVALADLLVLVVSKEKYADQSVWDMMAALAPLQQPMVICLNKLTEGSEAVLLKSLQEKWRQARTDGFPEVVPLHYHKQTGCPVWPEAKRQLLHNLQDKVNRQKHTRFEQAFIKQHWRSWLEPVVEEHQALAEWGKQIDEVISQALEQYQRDYLNHPHHYETFQQAMAELLTLLEIPGLAGVMTGARRALTWPIRQIMKLGRKRQHITDSSQEIALLNQIAEHLLIQLADRLLDKTNAEQQALWWKAMSNALRKQRLALLQDFSRAAKMYHIDFQQDVEEAAHRLYHKLQEQPMVLNSLRATRVTADAAVIALTLHTGGIGVHDLVIAPAMLTVTSLFAESAIGSYVHKVEAELKMQQAEAVKQALFIGNIAGKLRLLPEQLSALHHFNIPPAQLIAIEQQLTERQHGLRLL